MPGRFKTKGLSWLVFSAILAAVLLLSSAGCSDISTLSQLSDSSVTIDGIEYPSDTETVTLKEYHSEDYSLFAKLKNLRTLDVTALDLSDRDFQNINSQLGQNVNIIWSVPLSQGKQPSNSSELSFDGGISEKDANLVRYFTALKRLRISGAELNNCLCTAVTSATENNPDVQLNCSATIYGVPFDETTQLLDLNGVQIHSPDLLCLAIELFPNIRTIEMCDCGLSNEIMQGLREEYPQIRFVWMIRFLNYEVRTDIQVFSTLADNLSRPGNSEIFAPLFKYCTELRALDLGHQAITDISDITNLKHLHTLILADNHISDISPLAELKELVYIELFFNRIEDISPLLELPELLDLNLCYNPRINNPTRLTGCGKLERLYISHCNLSENDIATLRNGIPENCIFNYTCSNAVYGNGWRNELNVRNTKVREAFRNWRNVSEYPTWDNIIYR